MGLGKSRINWICTKWIFWDFFSNLALVVEFYSKWIPFEQRPGVVILCIFLKMELNPKWVLVTFDCNMKIQSVSQSIFTTFCWACYSRTLFLKLIIVIGPFYTTPLLFYSCFLYLTFACLGDLMTARVIVEDPYIIIMDLFHQKRSPIQMMVWMPMDSLHLEAVVSYIF